MKKEYERTAEFAGEKPLQLIADNVADFLHTDKIQVDISKEHVEYNSIPSDHFTVWENNPYEKNVLHICRFIRLNLYFKRFEHVNPFWAYALELDSMAFAANYLYYIEGIQCLDTGSRDSAFDVFTYEELIPSLGKHYTSVEQFQKDSLSGVFTPGDFLRSSFNN